MSVDPSAAVHERGGAFEGGYLCGCEPCLHYLSLATRAEPRLEVLLVTESDRIVVTAVHLLAVVEADGGVGQLLHVRGDRLRSMWVRGNRRLVPPEQWTSLARLEAPTWQPRTERSTRIS